MIFRLLLAFPSSYGSKMKLFVLEYLYIRSNFLNFYNLCNLGSAMFANIYELQKQITFIERGIVEKKLFFVVNIVVLTN